MSEKRRRVLLIDDDTSLVVTLGDFLRFEGYDVIAAHSGEQGLEALGRGERVDLIVLDMNMPGMGGMGFLEAIMDENGKPLFPVLVLTAKAHLAEDFANIPVDGFIAKPCDPRDLLMEVSRIVFLRHGDESIGQIGTTGRSKALLGDAGAEAETVARALADANVQTSRVETAADLLERAIIERPDVLVVNVTLPGMSLASVLNMLGEISNTRSTPVVIYAAAGDRSSLETMRLGGSKVVATVCPFTPEAVADAAVEAIS